MAFVRLVWYGCESSSCFLIRRLYCISMFLRILYQRAFCPFLHILFTLWPRVSFICLYECVQIAFVYSLQMFPISLSPSLFGVLFSSRSYSLWIFGHAGAKMQTYSVHSRCKCINLHLTSSLEDGSGCITYRLDCRK